MKKLYEIKKSDIAALILTVLSLFFICRVGIMGGFNIGLSVSLIALFSLSFIYLWKKNIKNKIFSVVLFICGILLCCVFGFSSHGLMKFCTILYLPFLCAFALCIVSGAVSPKNGTYTVYAEVIFKIFDGLFLKLETLFKSFTEKIKSGKNQKFVYILIGLGISVPLVCVILPLLTSSDIAFGNMVGKLFANIGLLVGSFAFACVFTPFVYSFMVSVKKGTDGEALKINNSGKVDYIVFNVILSVVCAIYTAYLFSQLAYITKAFSFLLPEDYSAAEFARSGFFEMGIISFINCLILGAVVVFTKRKNCKLPKSTKCLLVYLILFTCFYISTALIKMLKYISIYGLTTLRVLTFVFMVMLAIIFIIFLLRLISSKVKYVRAVILVCTAALMLVSVVDINSIIAEYNYSEYKKGNIEIDVYQIADMGISAVPTLVKLTEDKDKVVSEYALYRLLETVDYDIYFNFLYEDEAEEDIDKTKKKSFYEKNLSYIRAEKAVEEFFKNNKTKLKEYKDFYFNYSTPEEFYYSEY